MAGAYLNNSERNAMIVRFIMVYIICILLAIIPLYAFFSLPGWAEAKYLPYLKIDRSTDSKKDESIEKYERLVTSLDAFLKQSKLESDYRITTDSLNKIALSQIHASNPYGIVMKKVAELYDQIASYCYNSSKVDQLKTDNIKLEEDRKQLQKDLDE